MRMKLWFGTGEAQELLDWLQFGSEVCVLQW